MVHDDDTSPRALFEIDPSHVSKATLPMGLEGFMAPMCEWRPQGKSAKQIMDALNEKGVKGIELERVESFLRR